MLLLNKWFILHLFSLAFSISLSSLIIPISFQQGKNKCILKLCIMHVIHRSGRHFHFSESDEMVKTSSSVGFPEKSMYSLDLCFS